jgi:hypothetical protein
MHYARSVFTHNFAITYKILHFREILNYILVYQRVENAQKRL